MNKKLIVIVFLLWSSAYCAFGQANQWGPFDPGALRNDGSNASSAATVRDNLGLGTMAVATSTDYVATSALALRLDTTNASISNNLDVAGDVGAATLNGVAPLTAAEKTQALVGSSTVDFVTKKLTTAGPLLATPRGTSGFIVNGVSMAINSVASLTTVLGVSVIGNYGKITIARTSGDGGYADFFITGTTSTIVASSDTSAAWGTSAGSKLYNLYHDGASWVFQNNTGNVGVFTVTALAAFTH